MEWLALVPTVLLVLACVGGFIARNWIKARIENSVRHGFDQKIESVRAELRKSEEEFKSQLRSKELEIATLRDAAFSGRANRQALLDKRRLEAVEKLWAAFVALAPLKMLSAMMSNINVDAASARASKDPKIQKFFEIISSQTPEPKPPSKLADNEKIFLSELAWAYFSAYQAVLMRDYATAQVLKIGIDNPLKLINNEGVENLLKAALPHYAKFIEEYKSIGHYYLLEELEKNLIGELKKTLDGIDADNEDLNRAVEITKAVKELNQQPN